VVAAVRPIKEGGWLGNDWVVLEGLKEGDQVIADNLIKVRPGAPVNPHPFGAAPEMPAANPAKAK
jgi:membrane fusion protein (multidrug efflux system)